MAPKKSKPQYKVTKRTPTTTTTATSSNNKKSQPHPETTTTTSTRQPGPFDTTAGSEMTSSEEAPPVYFWRETEPETGYLSQWYPCAFTDDQDPSIVYQTAEQ